MSEEEEEVEKARVWLLGQKLAKSKFNKEAYERNKKEAERGELESQLEKEEENS